MSKQAYYFLIIFFLSFPAFGQNWEVYDFSGNLQGKVAYQDLELLDESVRVGKSDSSLFLLSADLRPIIDLQAKEVYQYLKPWIIVKGPGGLGAFHEYGQKALPTVYDEIQTYPTRLLAKKGSDYYVYEKSSGKTRWLGSSDQALLTHQGMVILKQGDSYYLPLSPTPEKAYEQLAVNEGNFLLSKEPSGFGLIDQEGAYVLEPVIDQLVHTRGDSYYGYDENQYLLIRGFENKAQVKYNSYHQITKEGDLMLEYIHGKLRRVIEEEGILLDAIGMESVTLIGKDLYNVLFRENKMGLLGKNGWLVTPNSDAEWIGNGTEGLFPAKKNGKYGFLTPSGTWVIPPNFLEVGTFSEKIAPFKNSSLWGLVSSDGKILTEPKWEEIKDFFKGISIAKSNGSHYLIRPTGELTSEIGFDKISRLKEGYFLVEKNQKMGLISVSGTPILPLEYDWIEVEHKDFIVVVKEGLSGVVKGNGESFLPVAYEQIHLDISEQKILAKKALEKPAQLESAPPSVKRKKGE
ncbi:MAG: WG repeat-containing protein [Bacteroidetes bacterium]|nr:WG repeat-containing protein [Bacteroidota bacterium]